MSTAASTGTGTTDGANPTKGRWGLVVAALLLQLSLGAVYAWSVFSSALQKAESLKLTKPEATLPFEVAIGMIFIGTYLGGRIQDRRGPRTVAVIGAVIYGVGVIVASFARSADQLWLLVLGYGVLAGFGLGLAYIVPIAMLQKWFPDKRGLITGLAVGGFGFGAVITAPDRPGAGRTRRSPTAIFLPLGIAYLVFSVAGALVFRNPPEGYKVPGYVPATSGKVVDSGRDYTQGEALRTWQWYTLAAILTLAVLAGISFISQATTSFADIAGYTRPGRGQRGRLPRPVQRRGPDLLGGHLRPDRPDAHVHRHPRARGRRPAAHPPRAERRRCSSSSAPWSTSATAAPSARCRRRPATSSA